MQLHPIGTKLQEQETQKNNWCYVIGYDTVKKRYKLEWYTGIINTWSYKGVHERLTVLEPVSYLPEELFHV